MIRGLPASLALHASVIFGGVIVWPYVSADAGSEVVVVPIELVTVGEITNIAPAIAPEPEPEPEPEVEEPEPPLEEFLDDVDTLADPEEPLIDTDDPPPPPDPGEADAEAPEDTLPELDPTEEALEPEEDPPEPEEEAQPREQDPLAGILDAAESTFKSERDQPQRARARAPRPQELEDRTPTASRRGAGDRTANTARIESLLLSQIVPCWDTVDDQPNPERLNVVIKIRLRQDGAIDGAVRVVQPGRVSIGDRPMQIAVERARRAVQRCEPFDLPPDDYELWRDVNVNVGPGFR